MTDTPTSATAIAEQNYTVQQVAERFGVHTRTIRRIIKAGDLESFRIGTQIRITGAHLAAYLARCTAGAAAWETREQAGSTGAPFLRWPCRGEAISRGGFGNARRPGGLA